MTFLLILLLLTGGVMWWLCPSIGHNPMRNSGIRIPYAHRGLHGPDAPENSTAAFSKAVRAGYGIELDVRLTRDRVPVVMHDASTGRMCGQDVLIADATLEVLRTLTLKGTAEPIPTLEETLACIAGRVPLLIELKSHRCRKVRKALCRKVRALLEHYPGFVAVESFDPRLLHYFRYHLPHVPRGQLIMDGKELPYWLLCHLPPLFLSRPHFIACEKTCRHLSLKIARLFRPVFLAWTIRNQGEWQAVHHTFDQMVFEAFLPCADETIR